MKKRRPITDGMKYRALKRVYVMVTCPGCIQARLLAHMEFDHWLALVDGGKHTVENIRPFCIPCHAEKSAREHIANCKAKRLAAGGKKRKGPPIKSRGFDKSKSKKFSGEVVERAK